MAFLEMQGLSSRYGAQEVLSDIDLSIQQGEVVALIGPSGSGKSTLLRTLIGLTPPTRGRLILDGEPLRYEDRASLRKVCTICGPFRFQPTMTTWW